MKLAKTEYQITLIVDNFVKINQSGKEEHFQTRATLTGEAIIVISMFVHYSTTAFAFFKWFDSISIGSGIRNLSLLLI